MIGPSSKQRIRSLAVFLLFLLPVLAYWVYSLLVQPGAHYGGIDPEYEYFLNSLAAFKHQPYTYVDHPGTPMETLGTALLAATYPWASARPEGFIGFHLRDPQLFLRLGYALLIAGHLACVAVFFRLERSLSPQNGALAALAAAALATMYFAVQPYAFSGSLLWSHNSFSFPLGGLLLLWLCALVLGPERSPGRRLVHWIGLGLGVGILAAITIFLVSWAAGALAVIVLYYGLLKRSWKDMAAAALSFSIACAAGFYLAVLPVIGRMGRFWNWIYSILSHQSNYLAVPGDQPLLGRLAENAAGLAEMLPALAAAIVIVLGLACAALVLWRSRISEQPGLWALAGGLAAQLIALVLVFLDRPLRAYYFLSVATVVPVLALVVLALFERAPRLHRLLSIGMSIAVLVGLLINSAQAIAERRADLQMQASSALVVQEVIAQRASQLQRAPESLTILWMYGTYSDCWGLWFANQRAGDAFDQEISHLCPNQYELTGRVLMPNARVPLKDMDWDIVFTCERYTDEVLARDAGAEVQLHPEITWTCGKMAAVLHR